MTMMYLHQTLVLSTLLLYLSPRILAQNSNATCYSGAQPYPLPGNATCPAGFYCPFLPLSPTFCSPTFECVITRMKSEVCEAQGTTEPVVCMKGYYCSTPFIQQICPSGFFCPTGTSIPHKCPPISYCPEGSFRPRWFGSLIICMFIDLFIITIYLSIRYYPRLIKKSIILIPLVNKRKQNKSKRERSSTSEVPSLEVRDSGGIVIDPEAANRSSKLLDGIERIRTSKNSRVTLLFEFERLRVTLPNGNDILQGISGSIRPGRVTAIMGPSGAGKTTFMNCLMGKIQGTGGSLRINHQVMDMQSFKKVIGYVPQDDIMLNDLTVRENIMHSARIRLPKNWTTKEIEIYVDSVIDSLSLSHVSDTIVGDQTRRGISGGQRKRTNIAVELAAAPLAIFLDEPTSGLDSTAALKVAEILRDMAQMGITVVAIIHQPRSEIFKLFDDILLIAPGGSTAYIGPQSEVSEYFQNIGFYLDPSSNIADQLLDTLSGKGRKLDDSDYRVQEILNIWNESEMNKSLRQINATDSDARSLYNILQIGKERGGNFLKQAFLCHNRSLVQQYRNAFYLGLELALSMSTGVLLGLANGYGQREQYRGILIEPYSLMSPSPTEWPVVISAFVIGIAVSIAGGPPGVSTFSEEKVVYFREAASGHNRFSYFLGKNVAVLYRQILSAFHFTVAYQITTATLASFSSVYSIIFGHFFCVYGLSALVSMMTKRENASLLGVFACLFASTFSGGYPSLVDADLWRLRWFWEMSYPRWLGEALYSSEVSPYIGIYQVHEVSEPLYGYKVNRFGMDIGIAIAIGIVIRVISYFVMIFVKRHKQK